MKLLDVPTNVLQQIVGGLDPADRKSLALTCHSMAAAVRLHWKTLLVNVYAEDAPPRGIAGFRCLETVIWTDGAATPEEAMAATEWEANPALEPPDERALPGLSAASVARLQAVTDLVAKAAGQPRPDAPEAIPPSDPSDLAASEYHKDLLRMLRPVATFVDDATRNMAAFRDRSLADQLAALEARIGVEREEEEAGAGAPAADGDGASGSGSSAAQRQREAQSSQDEAMEIVPSPSDRAAQEAAQRGRAVRLIIAAPLMLSGRDVQTLMFRIRPVLEVPEPAPDAPLQAAVDAMLESIAAKARPLPLPFTEVELGWFCADGHIAVQGVRGTVAWCPHDPPLIDLGGEAGEGNDGEIVARPSAAPEFGRLRALRICVKNCETDADATSLAFADAVLPALRSAMLPALRDLHLGRPFSFGHHLAVDLDRLDLPHLTRLVINEMVAFPAFAQLTHLSALRSLAVAMPAAGFEPQPQDLSTLSSLASLRSLRVEFWQVEEPQDVAALQQLTELELQGMEGRAHLTKPNRPMPNLAGVALTRLPHHQDMRYREDSKFARWALRRAAGLFPGVEVLHLGTLGSAPNEVATQAELGAAARVVDAHVTALLAAGGTAGLQYLQLDCVLNIMDDALDKRCETGSVALPATLEVPTPVGGVPAPAPPPPPQAPQPQAPQQAEGEAMEQAQDGEQAAAAAAALDEEEEDEDMEDAAAAAAAAAAEAAGPVVVWERTVEFVSCVPTDVLIAEFHYQRMNKE